VETSTGTEIEETETETVTETTSTGTIVLESSTTATETDESSEESTEWGTEESYSAPDDAIIVYITLNLDYSTVADDIEDRAAWVDQLIADLCYALDISDTSRVEILQVEPGSIKVIVAILPDLTGEDTRTLDEIVAELEEQLADSSSKLLEGVITSHTDTSVAITVIEPEVTVNVTSTTASETEGTTGSSESSTEEGSSGSEEESTASSESSTAGESAAIHTSSPSSTIASIVLFAVTAVLAHRTAL